MDEFSVILKARKFIKDAAIDAVPVDLARYAERAGAKIEIRFDLDDDESGQTFMLGKQHVILVNGNHQEERQRFTVLYEIGHIILELPSQHGGDKLTTSALTSYKRRPHEEMLCDVFAAECLLPYDFFKKDVDDTDPSFDAVRKLAARYKASVTSTGSRYAAHSNEPCAFVLMEGGVVRYATCSKPLREMGGWIEFGRPPPKNSVASRAASDPNSTDAYDEVRTDIWFNKPLKNYELLCEEAIPTREWDQCLSLIWLDESLKRTDAERGDVDDEEPLLRELDGILPWPSKSRRR